MFWITRLACSDWSDREIPTLVLTATCLLGVPEKTQPMQGSPGGGTLLVAKSEVGHLG